jgi:O-antigen ligase/polysaccharide polymerase Wzy-like membrane protein
MCGPWARIAGTLLRRGVEDAWHAAPMRRVSQGSVECTIVGVAALAIFVWWTSQAGGYFERDWMTGTLLLLVVGASSVIGQRRELMLPGRAATVALGALAAYVAWSFLSIVWAQTPGDALEGARRALAYLLFFAVFALLPWTRRALLGGLLAFIATMTGFAVTTLAGLAGDAPLADRFLDGSLLGPVGYHNASTALFTMAAVPALMLATRPELPAWLRPPLLAAPTLLLGLAALGQSRGWLLTLPIVAIAALALSPDRLKLALYAIPVFGGLALAAADIIDLGQAGAGLSGADGAAAMRAPLDVVVTKLTLATAGTLVIGAGLVLAEQRWQAAARAPLSRQARRRVAIALTGATLAAAAIGGLVASGGDPLDRIHDGWTQFTAVDYADSSSTGLGSGRYDFWRVALDSWRAHPVLGLGQDNFIEAYAASRRTQEEPRWVHSLPLRLLTHTGLVGAALFLAFVAALARAGTGAWRRAGGPGGRAAVGAALAPAIVWTAHGSVDWFWEVPALSAVVFAFAGAVVALDRPAGAPDRARARSRGAQRAITAATLAAVLVVGAVLLPEIVAERDIAVAGQTWRQDPAGAYARLDRAAGLNPLSPDAGLAEGRIALTRGNLPRARSAFAEAARRAPAYWYPRFALGLVASAAGDPDEARRQLRAAHARNPREPLIAAALRRVGGRAPLRFDEAQRRLDERRRVKRTQRG